MPCWHHIISKDRRGEHTTQTEDYIWGEWQRSLASCSHTVLLYAGASAAPWVMATIYPTSANASGTRYHPHIGLTAILTTRSSLAVGNPAKVGSIYAKRRSVPVGANSGAAKHFHSRDAQARLQHALLLLLAGKRWI